NERFNILPAGDGYYQIIASHSSKALDVRQGSNNDGEAIIQYAKGTQDNQRFKFAPYPASIAGTQSNTKDFYMIFASDTQYPWTDDDVKRTPEQMNVESERLNRNHIKSMQAIAAEVGKEKLKGVIINGDLTAFGHGYQLAKYKEMYDQGLGLKIYPGLGNHDYANNVNRCHENNCATRMVTYMNDFVTDLNPIS